MRRIVQQEVLEPVVYSNPQVEKLRKGFLSHGATHFEYYLMGECSVITTREPCSMSTTPIVSLGEPPLRWHMSVAHPERYPTWDELMMARAHTLPADLTFAQIFPGNWDEFINIHSNCFHVWEIHDKEV